MNISLSVSVQPEGQTAAVEVSVFDVEAMDKIEVTVPEGAADFEVDVCPGIELAIELIVIRASKYDATLTYKVHASTETAIPLMTQAVFTGRQDLLAGAAVPFDKLFFANASGEDIDLTIYCGRDATP